MVRWASVASLLLVAGSYLLCWYGHYANPLWGVDIRNADGRICAQLEYPAEGSAPLQPGLYWGYQEQVHRRTPFASTSYWRRLRWGFELGRMPDFNSIAGYSRMVYGVTVPLWAIALTVALASAPSWMRWAKRRGIASDCPVCGYDLAGLRNSACPECGRPQDR